VGPWLKQRMLHKDVETLDQLKLAMHEVWHEAAGLHAQQIDVRAACQGGKSAARGGRGGAPHWYVRLLACGEALTAR
jgi:hypothetical protein